MRVDDLGDTGEANGAVRRGYAVRVLVIVNTRSGGGDAGLYDYVRVLGTRGAEITLRFCDGDRMLEELVTDARSFDRVVAAGGDGTASALCYATRNTKVPILVYPAGTANLLAQNLGMPVEPRHLVETTLLGSQVDFDLGEIVRPSSAGLAETRTGFTIMAGAGYDAAIIDAASPMKANLGAAAYLLAAMGNMAPTAAHFTITLDGEEFVTDGIAVLIVNFGKLQFDVPVAVGADPRDGMFEVAVVRSLNVAALVPAVVAGLSGAVKLPGIDVYAAAHVSVSADPPLPMQHDGEIAEVTTPFSAHVLPHATRLLLPFDSEYAT
jgi:diacylglycerol kinase family enzyme